MSVVIALPGVDEIVVAADTCGYVGDAGGYYQFSGSKVREVGGKWLFCTAGSDLGVSLKEELDAEQLESTEDFRAWVTRLATRMHAVYKAAYSDARPSISALLCGFTNRKPQIGTFSFPASPMPNFTDRPEAIGAKKHGGLYFAYRYHEKSMSSDQRQLLAYFCVREVAKLDPRVDVPVELVIVRDDSVGSLKPDELRRLEKRSKRISRQIFRYFTGAKKLG